MLNKQDFQLNVVDILANDSKELEDYQQCFANYQQKTKELNQLREEIERNKQNADFLQFQYDELEAAQLVEGEQEELEQQSETMSHAEDIKTALYEADNALNGDESGVVSQVKSAYNAPISTLQNWIISTIVWTVCMSWRRNIMLKPLRNSSSSATT